MRWLRINAQRGVRPSVTVGWSNNYERRRRKETGMPQNLTPLINLAKTVVDFNWTGHYTQPGPRLYPHQWSWDSAFIAIGYARYNQNRAVKELNHLFSSQWENGLLP